MLSKDTEKTPTYIEMCLKYSRVCDAMICGVFYTDSLAVFLQTLCPMYLQSGSWPQQSTGMMFPLAVIAAIPAAPPQKLVVMDQVWSTSIDPVICVRLES